MRQVVFAVMACDASLAQKLSECQSAQLCKFGCFPQGKNFLRIECDGQLHTQALWNICFRQSQTLQHRVWYFQGHTHAFTIPRFLVGRLLLSVA